MLRIAIYIIKWATQRKLNDKLGYANKTNQLCKMNNSKLKPGCIVVEQYKFRNVSADVTTADVTTDPRRM